MRTKRKRDSPKPGLVTASHAKVNLFLEVIAKRPDGYHDIETVMHEISLADTVRIVNSPAGKISVECDPPSGGPSGRKNLAYRAADLLRRRYGIKRGVKIFIEKRIPAGAGLGGGSSNAAAVLKGLNKLWRLGLGRKELMELAAEVGSDVPFFIVGGTALCTGRGEKVKPMRFKRRLNFVIVMPSFGVSTAKVYRSEGLNLTLARKRAKLLTWGKASGRNVSICPILFNRLEEATFRLYPEIKRLKTAVARSCSGGALMCGSGSAVFGLCRDPREAAKAAAALRDSTGYEAIKAASR
jgi:4-diphosphocytidyl-2-C-methyl-D-erythritol kinase